MVRKFRIRRIDNIDKRDLNYIKNLLNKNVTWIAFHKGYYMYCEAGVYRIDASNL